MQSLQFTDQGSYLEAKVVLKLNQGTIRKKGCNPRPTGDPGGFFRGLFLVTFLDKEKSDKQNCLNQDL
jgi:hypothetical protein